MTEFDLIRRLREQMRSRKPSSRLIRGVGDDATVISQSAGRDAVITTDLLVEGIDFYLEATPPRLLGHKALAVSLSDIAAMGARPRWSLVSIGLPAGIWNEKFADEFFLGYLSLADQFGVTLAGGDVSETKAGIVIDSIVVGEAASGAAIMRSGARVGDQIYVTGTLGGAAAGLKLIRMGARVDQRSEVRGQRSEAADQQRGSSPTVREGAVTEPLSVVSGSVSEPEAVATGSHERINSKSDDAIQSLVLRQLSPSPRVGWGIVLGEERVASAMIDISDGLSSDLAHLCRESNVGALIQSDSLPLDADVVRLCGRRALDPLALALHGGEDFELLFTVPADGVGHLPKRVDGVVISHIGEITNEPNVIRIAEKNHVWELKPEGFEHFA